MARQAFVLGDAAERLTCKHSQGKASGLSVLANLETKGGAREKYARRLLVPNGAKNSFVTVNDIEWIEAADYYLCLHVGANTFMLRETIKELANQLDAREIRANRPIDHREPGAGARDLAGRAERGSGDFGEWEKIADEQGGMGEVVGSGREQVEGIGEVES